MLTSESKYFNLFLKMFFVCFKLLGDKTHKQAIFSQQAAALPPFN